MSDTSQTEATKPSPAPAAPESAAAASAAITGPEELLLAARKEAAASYDRYTRAVADLENFRKRALREKDELRQFAVSGLMDDVIPILDNLSLGLTAAQQQTDVKAITAGVTLVLEQFKTTLSRHGMKEVKPDGQCFDPHLHECISHQPSADVAEEHVMQVVRPGYTLNGRLLRPASVIVSSGPTKQSQA